MEKRLMMFLAALFLMVGTALAQTKVNGTVTSQDDGQPVIGASVLVVGTQVGTVTDVNGRFELTVPAGKKTLRITYVGMEPIEVSARPNMRIMLTSDQKALDEVIVVAYGTQKKSSFTGSAAVVGADEIGKVQVTNPVDALKGKAAGVQINTISGQPGEVPSIRIRGVNSINADSNPLIVVDGSPYDGSLNDINPTDVESMTVLKDAASTSLYGARGGNGVILITTKRGKHGESAKITFDAKWGSNQKAIPNYNTITSPAKYYEMWYAGLYNYAHNAFGYGANQAWSWANSKLTGSDSYGLGYNVYTVPNGQQLIGTDGKLNPNATLGRVISYKGNEYLLTPDDWMDETYNNGLRQEYTVSATGASDRSNFYISANYLSNEGITLSSDYKRFTGRLKGDYQLKEWLKVGGNVAYSHWNRNYLGNDGEAGSSGNAFATANMGPIYPVYLRDKNGNKIYDPTSRLDFYDYGDGSINGQIRPYLTQSNPLSANQLDTRHTEGNSVNATGEIEVRLPYGFTITSINNVYLREWRYTNTTNPFFGQYASAKGMVTKEHERVWSYNYQQRLNWRKKFGLHEIEAMGAHEYYRSYGYDLWASKQNQFSVNNKELAGAVVMGSANSSMSDYNDERWIGRAQYNYEDRYYVHASVTHEASSRFHPDNRWGTFWSLGGAWMISKEKWFNVKWIDELKFKASYGENGNDQIGSYQYIQYYSIANSNDNVSLVPSSLGNKDISWEKNAKFNIGFDFALFHNRLTGSIEYYSNKTNDMLSWYPLPASFGFTGYYSNIGNMRNNGLEIDLHYNVIRNRDLNWNVYANMTTNHNEITSLPDVRKTWYDAIQSSGYSSGSYFYQEGESRYSYYTRRYAGVYNEQTYASTGDTKFDPSKAGMALYYCNVYETRIVKDATGSEEEKTVYYDKDWNVIEDPDNYLYEKRRKKVGEKTTTTYSEADDYAVGDVLPDVYGGFGTSVSWKGIDFSIDFQYQLGGKVYDSAYASLMVGPGGSTGSSAGFAMHADLLNAYSATNTGSDTPRLQYNDTYAASASDRFLTSASYLSLQNITLGYTLPKKWTSKIGLEKVRIYGVADNVWVWSKRQGLDPRASITGASGNGYYAPIRTITGGISVTF